MEYSNSWLCSGIVGLESKKNNNILTFLHDCHVTLKWKVYYNLLFLT